MDFTVITPTGDRKEAFSICCKLMERQTIKPKQWSIVDDGLNETLDIPNYSFVDYHKRKRNPEEPSHTLPTQMQYALLRVKTDYVIVMEDDDWYDPSYFERTIERLKNKQLVGLVNNIYYFLSIKEYCIHANHQHSSLCSTAFSKELFPFFSHIPLNNPFVDLLLWRKPGRWAKGLVKYDPPLVLGIKGLPGRVGITYDSNRVILKCGMKKDHDLELFKSVVKEDFDLYTPYLIGTESNECECSDTGQQARVV